MKICSMNVPSTKSTMKIASNFKIGERSRLVVQVIKPLEPLELPDNAIRLSGGQCQRRAIARGLIKNAPIFILDEVTSALDNVSDRQVQASLETLMMSRTTLVIAHCLSTVQNADKIVVMDHGNVVEEGSHTELLAKRGAYAARLMGVKKPPEGGCLA